MAVPGHAAKVVGRILASPGTTKVVHNYRDYPGAIPIPATLSLELGKVVGEQQKNIIYRFVSDYPSKTGHRMRSMNSRRMRSAVCVKIRISS